MEDLLIIKLVLGVFVTATGKSKITGCGGFDNNGKTSQPTVKIKIIKTIARIAFFNY